jgi:hypothetical protein
LLGVQNGKVYGNRPRSEEEDLEETIQHVLSSVSTAGFLLEKNERVSHI